MEAEIFMKVGFFMIYRAISYDPGSTGTPWEKNRRFS
jgi:hypothetical protein